MRQKRKLPKRSRSPVATSFSPETAAKVGYYVYALVDPRKAKTDPCRIFYVGKGRRNRCFQHARAEIRWRGLSGEPNPKLVLIRKIRRLTGAPPPVEVLCHGLAEDEAQKIESILIKTLLTDGNLCGGEFGHSYCLTISEVEGLYSNPLPVSELENLRVMLVNIRGGGDLPRFAEIKERDLPRRVLGYWRIASNNASSIDFVVGVFDQLVRCVFSVLKDGRGLARFRRYKRGVSRSGVAIVKTRFIGRRAPQQEFLWCNRRIVSIDGETLTSFLREQGWKVIGAARE